MPRIRGGRPTAALHSTGNRFNMAAVQEPPVIYEPRNRRPSAAVIWLHGLGADGHDFAPLVPELGALRAWTRFIFPHAPLRPVSINFGMTMRAWYDIRMDGDEFVSDENHLRESQVAVEGLIAREIEAGIPAGRIVLAGFSQGGAVALQTALRHPHRLAGLMALSTYLPHAGTLAAERDPANADIPVFMAHGEQDPLIGMDRAVRSLEALRRLDYDVQWHAYRMAHAVCPQEIADIGEWLARVVPAVDRPGEG